MGCLQCFPDFADNDVGFFLGGLFHIIVLFDVERGGP